MKKQVSIGKECKNCSNILPSYNGLCEKCESEKVQSQIMEWKTSHEKATTHPKREYRMVSSGDSNKYYIVTKIGRDYSCNCPGFYYRKKCRHVEEAEQLYPPTLEEYATFK